MSSINKRILYKKLPLLERFQWDSKVRLGRNADGGYIIADELKYDLLLSGGIGGDTSFEKNFLQRYPDVKKAYGFDGTVADMSSKSYDNLFLVGKNIGTDSSNNETDLVEYIGDCKDIFLKMDIEGAEFDWILNSAIDFNKFKQMVIEFHPFGSSDQDFGSWFVFMESLKKLNKTHKIIHIHANNIAGVLKFECENHGMITLPRVCELTFVRSDQFDEHTIQKDTRPIPQEVDIRNFGHIPEISLSNFPWK